MLRIPTTVSVTSILFGVTVLSAPILHAQSCQNASAYLPLDDPAYVALDASLARGGLPQLSILERPYRVAAIRAAIVSDSGHGGAATRSRLVRQIERSLTRYDVAASCSSPGASNTVAQDTGAALAYRFDAELRATAQTSGRRELMLPTEDRGVYPGAVLGTTLSLGPVVGAAQFLIDPRLKHDPEFTGKKDSPLAGRTEDAYIDAQWRFGGIFFGRLARNWGPTQLDGLLLGHYAYTYDHAALTLGVPRFHLTTIVARLDDRFLPPDTVAQRYFSIHRLSARLANFEIAASEAIIYGGQGRGFEPKWINPLNGFYLSQLNESTNKYGSVGTDGNMSYGLEAAWHGPRGLALSAQGQLDDIQLTRHCVDICKKPPSYGVTVATEGIPIPLPLPIAAAEAIGSPRGFAYYTRVTNLTYRNATSYEQYMVNDVGLGRGFSDYDEIRAGVDVLTGPGIPLRLYGAFRRQGEGDYRIPQPPASQFFMTPTFLDGVVMDVARVGASSGGWLTKSVRFSGDIGFDAERNADHVIGSSRKLWVGRLVLAWVPGPLMAGHVSASP